MGITDDIFETFTCIYSQDNAEHGLKTRPQISKKIPRNGITCLEDKYKSRDDLGDKFLVRDAAENNYKLFVDFGTCLDYVTKKYEENTPVSFNEVIFGWRPQKIKFDIDVPKKDWLFPSYQDNIDFMNKLLEDVITSIRETFVGLYNEIIDREDIILCGGSDDSKISYHIIIMRGVISCDDAAYFTSSVCQKSKFAQYIDTRVNLTTQTFRVIYCSKPETSRIKIVYDHYLTAKNATDEDTIITNCKGVKIMPLLTEASGKRHINLHEDPEYPVADHELKMILDLAREWLDGYVYSNTEGNKILLRRCSSSFCKMCGRVHDSQNAFLYVCYNEKCNVYFKCYNSKDRKAYIGSFDNPKCEKQEHKSNKLVRVLTGGINPAAAADNRVLDNLPTTRYCEPVMRDFELARTLYVKAKMKMGKTKNLRKMIDMHFMSGLRDFKIIFISFRQTFSSNILEKFPEMINYSSVTGTLKQRKLIVQLESLHRLNIIDTEPFDLVVLDESESILEQFDSGLHGKIFDCIAKFKWLVRTCAHLVCMDAHIGERTYNIIERFRPGGGHYHTNEYKNAVADQYFITTDVNKYTHELLDVLSHGYTVGIPVSSCTEGKILFDLVRREYPEICIKMYSSETPENEKKTHFGNVNHFWKNLDVLIYTPTVSAGVSFEEEHFDYVFGYFTDKSCPVETVIQMLGRIRNVGMKEYYICIDSTGNNLPVTVEAILDDVKKNREAVHKNYSTNYLNYDYDDDGKIKIDINDNTFIWLENCKLKNLSKNYFMERFIKLIRETGAQCCELVCEFAPNIPEKRKNSSNYVREEIISAVITAPDIRDDEMIDISAKISAGGSVTDAERTAYRRKQLRMAYGWTGEITRDFATIYMEKSTKRHYKNLKNIFAMSTIDESLKVIKERELAYSKDLLLRSDYIIPKFTFNRHRIAAGVIKIIGFKHYNDPQMLPQFQVEKSIIDNAAALKCLAELQRELEFKVDYSALDADYVIKTYSREQFVKNVIEIYNGAINNMYGVKIKFLKNEELYKLIGDTFRDFSFTQDGTNRPIIKIGI